MILQKHNNTQLQTFRRYFLNLPSIIPKDALTTPIPNLEPMISPSVPHRQRRKLPLRPRNISTIYKRHTRQNDSKNSKNGDERNENENESDKDNNNKKKNIEEEDSLDIVMKLAGASTGRRRSARIAAMPQVNYNANSNSSSISSELRNISGKQNKTKKKQNRKLNRCTIIIWVWFIFQFHCIF